MRKIKTYLDTSTISHLYAPDVPDRQEETLELWEEIKSGKYDVYISEIVLTEINENKENKKQMFLKYLNEIKYKLISINDDMIKYANELNRLEILSNKHFLDCLHLGAAVISDCDMLLSWNFRHMVKVKTINGVKYINSLLGYREIGIYAPSMILERSE